jgi:hypothetical protein
VGALSVSGPIARFTEETVSLITTSVLDAARQLTSRLGGDASVYEASGTAPAQKAKRADLPKNRHRAHAR